jgi:NADH pyrophosphatase NudC (nudix superfamily)
MRYAERSTYLLTCTVSIPALNHRNRRSREPQQRAAQDTRGNGQMEGRYTAYPRTLTFLLQGGDDVLLIQRSPNARLFPGLFNGVGGHVERGENVLSAARREVHRCTKKRDWTCPT